MRRMVLRAMCWKSILALVVISPASTTRLSFTSVSAATRERGSWARIASSTASEIWSATLSGWPSETDSEVKRKSLIAGVSSASGRPQGYQILSRLPALILRIVGLLPLRVLHALGTFLGWITYGMSPTYRRHLREHLAQAGFDDARVRREAIAAAGRMIAEMPAIWFRPQAAVAGLIQEVHGLDAVLAARAQGREIVFLAPHLGCFEITVQYTSLKLPITALYRPPKMRWLDPLMRAGRGRPTIHLVPADLGGVRQL